MPYKDPERQRQAMRDAAARRAADPQRRAEHLRKMRERDRARAGSEERKAAHRRWLESDKGQAWRLAQRSVRLRIYTWAPNVRTFYVGQCGVCAEWFTTTKPTQRWCSYRCKNIASSAPWRVHLRDLIARDGLRCWLCHKPISRKVPSPAHVAHD